MRYPIKKEKKTLMRKSLLESLLSIHGSSQQNRDKWIETDKQFFFFFFLPVRVDSFRSILIAGFHTATPAASASTCASRRVDWPTVMSLMYTSTTPVRVGNDYRSIETRRSSRRRAINARKFARGEE